MLRDTRTAAQCPATASWHRGTLPPTIDGPAHPGRFLQGGAAVTSHQLTLAALVVLLLPMFYFLFASLTFFIATLEDPVVTGLLKSLFNAYFLVVASGGALAVVAFGAAGRPLVAAAVGLVALSAAGARSWFLRRLDAGIGARDRGDAGALGRLRRLHVGGIAYNAVQLGALVAGVPAIFPGA
jgi:hypothetical protein